MKQVRKLFFNLNNCEFYTVRSDIDEDLTFNVGDKIIVSPQNPLNLKHRDRTGKLTGKVKKNLGTIEVQANDRSRTSYFYVSPCDILPMQPVLAEIAKEWATF